MQRNTTKEGKNDFPRSLSGHTKSPLPDNSPLKLVTREIDHSPSICYNKGSPLLLLFNNNNEEIHE